MAFSQLGVAVPNFWFGILLVLWFSIGLGWFEAGGFPGWSAGIGPALKSLTLPAFTLGLTEAAILALGGVFWPVRDQDPTRAARIGRTSRDLSHGSPA